jgi:hypothetical protein
MQYEWREDLLPEEKRARLQEKTDQFLGARGFQDLSSAALHRIENYDLAVQLATCDAVTSSTTAKQDCYWRYWKTYLKAIELDNDPYLRTFTLGEQH